MTKKYTKEHEWIKADGTVGITHHAQEKLGDIVFVELPAVGRKLAAMESFGTVESVKAVSDLYCPAGGTVTEVNSKLAEKPELLNQDPHGSAWLIKIKLDNPKELDALLAAPQYEQFIAYLKEKDKENAATNLQLVQAVSQDKSVADQLLQLKGSVDTLRLQGATQHAEFMGEMRKLNSGNGRH